MRLRPLRLILHSCATAPSVDAVRSEFFLASSVTPYAASARYVPFARVTNSREQHNFKGRHYHALGKGRLVLNSLLSLLRRPLPVKVARLRSPGEYLWNRWPATTRDRQAW
jgi:hypothetical protein